MRKFPATTLILLLLTASSSLAQSMDELSLDQLQLFKQNNLRIELTGIDLASESGEDLTLGYSKHWAAYRGFGPVSEIDFYDLAGREVLARRTQRSRRDKFVAIGLGGLSVVAGSILLATGNARGEGGRLGFSMGQKFAGGLLIAAGSGTVGIAALSLQQRTVPYRMAREVASEYNARLMQELSEPR